MKKLICFVALIISVATITKAQGVLGGSGSFAGRIQTNKTHTNAMADTVLVTITQARTAVTFKYDVAKTSGTVAGTIVLQARLTNIVGEQWWTLDSYALTDGAQTDAINFTANSFLYYRIITTTTGTSVTVHNKYLLYRP